MTLRTKLFQQWYFNWLWLTHSYGFRWAHKPLCDRFHDDSLHIGTLHICRGCTFLYLGLFLSLICCFYMDRSLIPIMMGLSLFVMPLSYPTIYRRLPRVVKDSLRFLLGVIFTSTLLLVFTIHWWIGVCCFVIFYIYRKHINHVRADLKKNACEGCPELGGNHVCSGYKMQAECSRRYDEKVSAMLTTQYHPTQYE